MDESRIEKLLKLDERGATEATNTLLSIANQVEEVEAKNRPWRKYVLWRLLADGRSFWRKCGGRALEPSTSEFALLVRQFWTLDPIREIRSKGYTFDELYTFADLLLEMMRIKWAGLVFGAPVIPMMLTSWGLFVLLDRALAGASIPFIGPSSHVTLYAIGLLLAFMSLFCMLQFVMYVIHFALELLVIFFSLRPILLQRRW